MEGYAGLPAYLTIDPRWVSFEDEKEQTAAANRMMTEGAGPSEIHALAGLHDVRYVLVDTTATPHAVRALLSAGFALSVEVDRMAFLSRIDGRAAQ